MPGFLLGCHLTLLIAFLNPALPLSQASAARLALGLVPGLALASWTILAATSRPEQRLRHLPWWIAAELVVAAVLYAFHLWWAGFGIHPGVARRLLKAAVSLGVLGLVAFYTGLLHSLTRRPYGRRSRLLFLILSLLSLWVAVERRETFRPVPLSAPSPNLVSTLGLPVTVVWLEGASLELLLPLAEQDLLPFFAGAFADGAFAPVDPLRPAREQVQRIATVTGKLPYRSGYVAPRRWLLPESDERIALAPPLLPALWWRAVGFREAAAALETLPFWRVWSALRPEDTLLLGLDPSDPAGPAAPVELDRLNLGVASGAARMVRIDTTLGPTVAFRDGAPEMHELAKLRQLDASLSRLWAERRAGEHLVVFSSPRPSQGWGRSHPAAGLLLLLGPGAEARRIAKSVRAVDVAATILHLAGYPSARDLDGRVRTDLLSFDWRRRRPISVVPSYDFLALRSP